MNLATKIQNTTAFIYYDNNFVSSAVVFKYGSSVYTITAGHSIYGQNFDEEKDKNRIKVQISNIDYNVSIVLGSAKFAREHDIEILKIDCNSESIENIQFTSSPVNSLHSLIFRGKNGESSTINNVRKNYFDECKINTTKYKIDCNKDNLRDNLDNYGSDWLGGFSGSGLFYEDKEKIFCCGIVVEIIDKGNFGKILCASIPPLQELMPELVLVDNNIFDMEENLTNISLAKIIDETNIDSVKEWENSEENNIRLKFINEKFPNLYPPEQIEQEKCNLIKRFKVGLEYIHNELSQLENLKRKYDDAYKVFTLEDKTIYANSKQDARKELDLIKSKYEKYLTDSLQSKGFDTPTITLLKEYAISEWISDCSVSIIKDE